MSHDSPRSRRADAFDQFRRALVLDSRPAAGDDREAWFARFKELLEASFPDETKHFRKPGLATRVIFAEVETPGRDKDVLHDVCQELDINWQAMTQGQFQQYQSFVYLDRLDAVWEWCADLGGAYITGAVKLRNAPFVGQSESSADRPKRFGQDRGDRPQRPWQDRGDRPQRPWQDRGDRPQRPWQDRGDRPQRPWQDRGDRPQRPWQDRGDRPQRPWQDRGDRPPRPESGSDRPGDPTDGPPHSESPRPWKPPYRKGPGGGGKGRPPFGPKRRPYRPKD
jgi:hypothetical protein